MKQSTVTVGLRFRHRRRAQSDYKTPALCEVTRIESGMVYYHMVDENTGQLQRTPAGCCAIEEFHRHTLHDDHAKPIHEVETVPVIRSRKKPAMMLRRCA